MTRQRDDEHDGEEVEKAGGQLRLSPLVVSTRDITSSKSLGEKVEDHKKSGTVIVKCNDDDNNDTSASTRRQKHDDDLTTRQRQHDGVYSRVGAYRIRGLGSDGTGFRSSIHPHSNYDNIMDNTMDTTMDTTTAVTTQQQQQENDDVFVSAFMVEEIDEETLAKRAEENAREHILQETVQGKVVEPQKELGHNTNQKNRVIMMFLIGLLLAVVIIVVVVAVVVIDRNYQLSTPADGEPKKEDETAIPVPLSDYDYLVNILSPISGSDLLLNETSSQNDALYWILEQDDFFTINNTTIQTIQEAVLIQRYILAVLYFTTQGENWSQDISFLSNSSVCDWPPKDHGVGVQCNSNGRVTDIDLAVMNLNGTVPAELGFLPFLRNLFLDRNLLQGSLPDTFSQLDRLVKFSISSNYITGTIPEFVTELNKIELFYLPDNYITGTLQSDIFQIETLTRFSAGANLLTGTIPEFIVGGKFEVLELDFNMLEGSIPESVYTNTGLLSMGLYFNNLSSTLSTSIGNLRKMEFLYIDGNKLQGTLPTELGLLASVNFIWLQDNDFTGTIPSEIGNLAQFNVLSELYLSSNEVSGEVPLELGLLKSAFTIDIGNTSISGDLDPVFCENEAFLASNLRADCGGESPEVTCSCCTACCNDNESNGRCEINVLQICSNTAGKVLDPERNVDFVIILDDVKPVKPSCECTEIPSSANRTSSAGLIPVMELKCNESPNCTVCSQNGSVCGQRVNYGFAWDNNGVQTLQTMGFQYTKGLDDFLLLEFDNSLQNPPYPEVVYLNGEKCNQLQSKGACSDGNPAFVVDCSNVQEGAVYSQCEGFVENAGALEYFTPSMYRVSSTCDG